MSDNNALRPGATLADRYEIETSLGAVGAGPVYRALDMHLARRVTLRTFNPEGWTPEARERFEYDVRAATPLEHANVAGIRDFGSDPATGLYFVVYEPVNGETLATHLKRAGRPTSAAALKMVQEVAEGIGAAHWAGLVHGELHPGTIFLSRTDVDRRTRAQVLFPGLQLASFPGSKLPPSARYSAPEVLRRSDDPIPASDVFSLGVVAYELIGGLPSDWSSTLIRMARNEPVRLPAPSGASDDVPLEFAEAVEQALRPEAARRFTDANALAIVLAHASDASLIVQAAPRLANVLPDFLRDDEPEAGADGAEPAGTPHAVLPASEAHAGAGAAPEDASHPVLAANTASPAAHEDETPSSASLMAGVLPFAPAVGEADGAAPDEAPDHELPAQGRSFGGAPLLAAGLAALIGVGSVGWYMGSRNVSPSPVAVAYASDAGELGRDSAFNPSWEDDAAAAAEEQGPSADAEEVAEAAPRVPDRPETPRLSQPVVILLTVPQSVDPAAGAGVRSTDAALADQSVRIAPPTRSAPRVDTDAAPAPPPTAPPTPRPGQRPELVTASGDAVYGVSQLDTPPALQNQARLQRELQNLRAAGGGHAMLEFVILPNGRVDPGTLIIVESSNRALAEAAGRVMGHARFSPGKLSGSAVAVRVRMPLVLDGDG
jgi:serine/threonine protein kinase/outer membrane biosynthesis protein TonB